MHTNGTQVVPQSGFPGGAQDSRISQTRLEVRPDRRQLVRRGVVQRTQQVLLPTRLEGQARDHPAGHFAQGRSWLRW